MKMKLKERRFNPSILTKFPSWTLLVASLCINNSYQLNDSCMSELEKELRKSKIIPKQLVTAPNETLWIRYLFDKPIDTGWLYYKEDIKGCPQVRWRVDPPPVYYTLVCIGLNEWQLFDKKPENKMTPIPLPELIRWIVVNIPANDHREGSVIHPYKRPTPIYGYDKLAYLFLVYKQETGIRVFDYRFLKNTRMKQFLRSRKQDFAHLREFEKFYKIYNIVAANFFWYKFRKQELSEFFDSRDYP